MRSDLRRSIVNLRDFWRKRLILFGLKEDGAERRKPAVWHVMGKSFYMEAWWSKGVPSFSDLAIFYAQRHLQEIHITNMIVSGWEIPLVSQTKNEIPGLAWLDNYCTAWSALLSGFGRSPCAWLIFSIRFFLIWSIWKRGEWQLKVNQSSHAFSYFEC